MVDESRWPQYGKYGLDVKGITIHNTGTQDSAEELFEYLNNDCKYSTGCHFLVDKDKVIQVMPLNWSVYHTGKGEDVAFKKTIAIEICNSLDDFETYLIAQNRAIKLIKKLLKKYNLTTKIYISTMTLIINFIVLIEFYKYTKQNKHLLRRLFNGYTDIN